MVIPLGAFLKKLQLDNNERSKDMAAKLGVTPNFLSRVCTGNKKCPDSWYEKIPAVYELDNEKNEELRGLIAHSNFLRSEKDLSEQDKALMDLLTFMSINTDLINDNEKEVIMKTFKRFGF